MIKHPFTLLSIFIVTVATVAIVQTVAVSLTPTEINQVAKQFVVRIDGSLPMSNGSGSIIGKQGNLYQVLTNWHVVNSSNNPNEFTIQTIDGKTHPVIKIEQLKGADLAIITFESDNKYIIVELGNSDNLKEGQTIHFAGYPVDNPRRYRFFKDQSITGFESPDAIENGYDIIFTGEPLPGMSGSPLINNEGEIIGVYGIAKINFLGGLSLYGIRINTAIELAEQQKIHNFPTLLISPTTEVDYGKLRRLLQAEKWKKADQLTWELILKAAKRKDEGWLDRDSLENFPCEDLRIMDQEWKDASDGKFGFGVQQKLWQKLGSPDSKAPIETWIKFWLNLGWNNGKSAKDKDWTNYDNFTFDPQEAPQGHLPYGLYHGGRGPGGANLPILFSHCDLQIQSGGESIKADIISP